MNIRCTFGVHEWVAVILNRSEWTYGRGDTSADKCHRCGAIRNEAPLSA